MAVKWWKFSSTEAKAPLLISDGMTGKKFLRTWGFPYSAFKTFDFRLRLIVISKFVPTGIISF